MENLEYDLLLVVLNNLNYSDNLTFFCTNKNYNEIPKTVKISTFYKFSIIYIISQHMKANLFKKFLNDGSCMSEIMLNKLYRQKYQNFNKLSFLLDDGDFFLSIKLQLSALKNLKADLRTTLLEINHMSKEYKWLFYVSDIVYEQLFQCNNDVEYNKYLSSNIININKLNAYDNVLKPIGIVPFYGYDRVVADVSIADDKYYLLVVSEKIDKSVQISVQESILINKFLSLLKQQFGKEITGDYTLKIILIYVLQFPP